MGGLGGVGGLASTTTKSGGGATFENSTSRRRLLESLLYAAPLLGVIVPRRAEAIGIESIYEALPSLYSSPSPVTVPRRTFGDTAFAVALLRSGYETVDDLDFFPMDTWQKEFWLKRRSEYEAYTIQNEPLKVQQGDLSSPLYFDFIAAMQFWTVDKSLRDPKQRFREFCGEECGESQYRMVTRDGRYSDDARLPQYFADKFGQRVYDKLRELGTPLSIESAGGDPTSIATIVEDFFVREGFALKSEVTETEQGITIKTTGAATLWALQYLTSRKSRALPLYDTAVIQHLLKTKLGLSSTVTLVDLSDVSVTTQIQISRE